MWTNVNLNITSINDVKETNLIYTNNQTLSHILKCSHIFRETLKKIKNPQLLFLETLTIPLYTGGERIVKGLEIQVKGKLSYLN